MVVVTDELTGEKLPPYTGEEPSKPQSKPPPKPQSKTPSAKTCCFGAKCNRENCELNHDCRYKKHCTRLDCIFRHPSGWNPRANIECRFGLRCRSLRKDATDTCPPDTADTCPYKHPTARTGGAAQAREEPPKPQSKSPPKPQSKTPSAKTCCFGAKCNRENCELNHDCRYKKHCTRLDCIFRHPSGWNPRANIECRFGLRCRSPDTCPYKH